MSLVHVTASNSSSPSPLFPNHRVESKQPSSLKTRNNIVFIPTMSDIMESSKFQNLNLQLRVFGTFFNISAKSLDTGGQELGRADGFMRVWFGGRILHLDSIRLRRERLSLKRFIFGTGLHMGAVAVRHGFDCGCNKSGLLSINDTDLSHSKLVRFYHRMGFKAVPEVTGSSIGDLPHMLVLGGKGTRMDADIEELLLKWGTRFKTGKDNRDSSCSSNEPNLTAIGDLDSISEPRTALASPRNDKVRAGKDLPVTEL